MAESATPASGDDIVRTVTLRLDEGLHVRPCSQIAAVAGQSAGQVTLRVGDRSADASSMLEMMALGVEPGTELQVVGTETAAASVEQIVAMFESNFAD